MGGNWKTKFATALSINVARTINCALGGCLVLSMALATNAASLQLVTNNWGTNGVPSTVSMYIYVPNSLAANPPILVLCHYCGGSASGVFGEAEGGGIVAACDQYGFIMVVPQAVNPDGTGRCWDMGSTSALTRNGGGDTEAIAHMVNYTVTNYDANSNRVYVTGTSSGAMMTEALLALYPDVFKAGAEFSGVPAGGWAVDNPTGAWSGPCASGEVTHTPQEWGAIARALDPGFSGPRPRVQLWHGTADTTIYYPNQTEAIKEWTDVLGLSANPTSTTTLRIGSVTNQWQRQSWQDSCGNTVLDAWSEQNGPHGTDANLNAQYVIPFMGLNKSNPVDPVPPCDAPDGLAATAISTNQVSVTWIAVTKADSYNVKRSVASGGPYVTIAAGVAATDYTDTIAAGMNYYYVVSAVSGGVETANSAETVVEMPYPWMTEDIGAVQTIGSAGYSNALFTVSGAGADITGTADAFRFTYVTVTGDSTIIARVTSVQNINSWSKAGVMIRQSLNSNSANALIAVTPGNGVTWQYRSSAGGNTTYNNTAGLNAPYWVKMVRSGNTFIGYRSANGMTWTQQGTATFAMASTVYVGLAVTSHDSSNPGMGTLDNVTAPGWPNATPPAAPAGLTATAGNTQAALNWAPSGTAISYNVKRGTTNAGPYAIVTNVTTTNYTDTSLTNGAVYYYVVSALNLTGESANSAQVGVTPIPQLNAAWTAGSLTIMWPLASAGFTLQSRTNLVLGGWNDVTSPAPQMIGNQWEVTLSPSSDGGLVFYRLVK